MNKTIDLTIKSGEVFNLLIYNDLDSITELNPGNYLLDPIDSDFFVINYCQWLRYTRESESPALLINLTALRRGNTKVSGLVQLSHVNPSYFRINYNITII